MKKLFLVVGLVLCLALVACGGESESPSSDAKADNPTKNEQKAEDSASMNEEKTSETVTAEVGEISFEYPKGWNQKSSGQGISVTNPDDTCLVLVTPEALAMDMSSQSQEIKDLLTYDAVKNSFEEIGMSFSTEYEEKELGNGKARIYSYESGETLGDKVGYMLIAVTDTHMYNIMCTTGSEDFNDFENVISDVLDSVSLKA